MKEKLEKHTYPKFFTAFEKLLEQHGKDYFCGPKVCPIDTRFETYYTHWHATRPR
jgi:hypothetical protein